MLKKLLWMALPLPIFACGPTISVGAAWFLGLLALAIFISFIVALVKYNKTNKLRFLVMTIPFFYIVVMFIYWGSF